MNYDHILDCARAAFRMDGTGYLSTGESLAAALVLNRHDWLKALNYTIAEALDRADDTASPTFIADLRQAERQIDDEIAEGLLVVDRAEQPA